MIPNYCNRVETLLILEEEFSDYMLVQLKTHGYGDISCKVTKHFEIHGLSYFLGNFKIKFSGPLQK